MHNFRNKTDPSPRLAGRQPVQQYTPRSLEAAPLRGQCACAGLTCHGRPHLLLLPILLLRPLFLRFLTHPFVLGLLLFHALCLLFEPQRMQLRTQ